jgi:hypothetical protein
MSSVGQLDALIKDRTNTIAGVEAHLAALHHELRQLKLARNARTPLFQLPNEILIRVAAAAASDTSMLPRTLYNLTAVCHALRTLQIDAPELWTHIDTSWDKRVVNQFATRAATREIDLTIYSHHESADMLEELPAVRTLSLVLDKKPSMDYDALAQHRIQSMMDDIQYRPFPCLRTLCIEDQIRAGWPVTPTLFHSTPSAQLTTMVLHNTVIAGLPPLTALRSLKMAHCRLDLPAFRACLMQTPALERLRLLYALEDVDQDRECLPQQQPVRLPALARISLKDNLVCVSAIIDMLPVPSQVFHVVVHGGNDELPPWFRSAGYRNSIMPRLQNFAARVTGAGVFPAGELVRSVDPTWMLTTAVVFSIGPMLSAMIPHEDAPLFFAVSLKRRTPVLPGLPLVDRIRLVYNPQNEAPDELISAPPTDIDVRSLVFTRHLVIQHARTDRIGRGLEAWIIVQRADDVPFQSIEFCDYDESVIPLYERLKANNARFNTVVTWR